MESVPAVLVQPGGLRTQSSLLREAFEHAVSFIPLELTVNSDGFFPIDSAASFPIVQQVTYHLLAVDEYKSIYNKIQEGSSLATFWSQVVRF